MKGRVKDIERNLESDNNSQEYEQVVREIGSEHAEGSDLDDPNA